MSTAEAGLSVELEFFKQHRSEWVDGHTGEFVLIHGNEAEGFYPDYESALKAGLRVFGFDNQFLIKQIWIAEPVFVIY
jgi:hypothetical protein